MPSRSADVIEMVKGCEQYTGVVGSTLRSVLLDMLEPVRENRSTVQQLQDKLFCPQPPMPPATFPLRLDCIEFPMNYFLTRFDEKSAVHTRLSGAWRCSVLVELLKIVADIGSAA